MRKNKTAKYEPTEKDMINARMFATGSDGFVKGIVREFGSEGTKELAKSRRRQFLEAAGINNKEVRAFRTSNIMTVSETLGNPISKEEIDDTFDILPPTLR